MTSIIYRPDPPADTASDRRVQRASQVQNDEAHARLFERALVRAEAERKSDVKTTDKALDKQHQIDHNNDVHSSLRRADSIHSALTDSDTKAAILPDEPLQSDNDSSLEQETPVADSDDESNTTTNLFFSDPVVANYEQGPSELFQHNNSDDSKAHDNAPKPASTGQENSFAQLNELPAQSDTGVARLTDLSSFYDLVQSDGDWSSQKEWSFTFEDDGPVSELTLAREEDGRWHVGVTAPELHNSGDSTLLDVLQIRLEDVGLAVASVSVTEKDLSS